MHAPPSSDIIFVEYALNDPANASPPMDNNARRSYERLIRKLLLYPNRPAVVLYHAFRWFIVGDNFTVSVLHLSHALL